MHIPVTDTMVQDTEVQDMFAFMDDEDKISQEIKDTFTLPPIQDLSLELGSHCEFLDALESAIAR